MRLVYPLLQTVASLAHGSTVAPPGLEQLLVRKLALEAELEQEQAKQAESTKALAIKASVLANQFCRDLSDRGFHARLEALLAKSLPREAQLAPSPESAAQVLVTGCGFRGSLVTPEEGIRRLLQEAIGALMGPSLEGVESIRDLLWDRFKAELDRRAEDMPQHREALTVHSLRILDLWAAQAKALVGFLVEVEAESPDCAAFHSVLSDLLLSSGLFTG